MFAIISTEKDDATREMMPKSDEQRRRDEDTDGRDGPWVVVLCRLARSAANLHPALAGTLSSLFSSLHSTIHHCK